MPRTAELFAEDGVSRAGARELSADGFFSRLVSIRDRGQVRLGFNLKVQRLETAHGLGVNRVGQDMGEAQVIVVARSGLGHGSKLPSLRPAGWDAASCTALTRPDPAAAEVQAAKTLRNNAEFLGFLRFHPGIGAEQAAQRGQPGCAGRPCMAFGHPGVHSAVDGGGVMLAAAFTGIRAGFEVGEGPQDPVRVHVGEAEGPDAGCVDNPAPGGRVTDPQGKGRRRRVPSPPGDGVDASGCALGAGEGVDHGGLAHARNGPA